VIFVSVGMHTQGFIRLIQKMDEIAEIINEEVIMQIGFTEYQPKNAKFFDFITDFKKLTKLFREARIVVCHGGAGTIITALNQGTPVISVPRLKKYHEILDNHQIELLEAFEKEGIITVVRDINNLENIVKNHDGNPIKIKKERRLLMSALKYFLKKFEVKEKKIEN
jgi:UDP-N-acetylglucosamine transferase subunit ALG13